MAYAREAIHGSPVHYGFSASRAVARMQAVAGVDVRGGMTTVFVNLGNPEWQREASASQVVSIVDQIAMDLADGALGVGLLLGYAPAVHPDEYLAVAARLAAEAIVPTFTHCRDLVEIRPETGWTEPKNSSCSRHDRRAHDTVTSTARRVASSTGFWRSLNAASSKAGE